MDNVPAKRLERFLGIERREEIHDLALHKLLDDALAHERRITVERIKATQPVAVLATDGGPALAYAMRITEWLDSIATGTEEEGK